MTETDVENGNDTAGSLGKFDSIKISWDPTDLAYFFMELESKMDLRHKSTVDKKTHISEYAAPYSES